MIGDYFTKENDLVNHLTNKKNILLCLYKYEGAKHTNDVISIASKKLINKNDENQLGNRADRVWHWKW